MIELQLTDDHEALVQTVREFAQKEVAPYIKEWDEKQQAHPEIFKKMAALNLLGVCIPEQYGGAGFDYISLGLVCEELEAVDTFLRVGTCQQLPALRKPIRARCNRTQRRRIVRGCRRRAGSARPSS